MTFESEPIRDPALLRLDRIIDSVGATAGNFLRAPDWRTVIDASLRSIGEAVDADRAYIYENTSSSRDLLTTLRFEWVGSPDIAPLIGAASETDFALSAGGFARWIEVLGAGGVIDGPTSSLPVSERGVLESQGVRSIVVVPIFFEDQWWGYIGLDDCTSARDWSSAEIDALAAIAGIIGAAGTRASADARVRRAEEQYKSLIEQIPSAAYTVAKTGLGKSLYMSPRIEDILGTSPQEWLDNEHMWEQTLHPDDRAWAVERGQAAQNEGEEFNLEYRMVAKDGHTVWIRDQARLMYDESGIALFWQGVMVDISAERREIHLEEALAIEREDSNRLRELDGMKNTFLTAVSHDFRTPLAAILGLALTLEREDLGLVSADGRDLVERVARNARKLDRLVGDLLDLDRLTRGILEPRRHPVDVGALIAGVVEDVDFMGEHPIIVEAESVVVPVDGPKIERIVENLLANAARHTRRGARVWVRVRAFEDGVLIVVEDEGEGIAEENRDSVFEAFRQGEQPTNLTEHAPGVGIGLSLVARFAELHGGRAWVEEREGGGASFHVFIPSGGD